MTLRELLTRVINSTTDFDQTAKIRIIHRPSLGVAPRIQHAPVTYIFEGELAVEAADIAAAPMEAV